ncbi:MAG: hypothetical protein KA955_05030 [Prevotella sp.]|nr:hypothetical protein [Prevotella sp.]
MKLHIFNPEHDIALAYNNPNITAPHLVRQLRRDLAYMPALWADDGDAVLVDDVESAQKNAIKFLHKKPMVVFITKEELNVLKFTEIQPWGWDKAICHQLTSYGFGDYSMPDDLTLKRIRDLSNRVETILLMANLRDGLENITCGNINYCTTVEEIMAISLMEGSVVLKAPWSSSGRGIRFVNDSLDVPLRGWCNNLLNLQGGIIVETYYNKVKDFAMEFYSNGLGEVSYRGLSFFDTTKGAYSGNLLATDELKEQMLAEYIPKEVSDEIKFRICNMMGDELKNVYKGPFGVDMMVVADRESPNFLLDPCVEINLRRTMGHVALAISPDDNEKKALMRINYNKNYKLKINKL